MGEVVGLVETRWRLETWKITNNQIDLENKNTNTNFYFIRMYSLLTTKSELAK